MTDLFLCMHVFIWHTVLTKKTNVLASVSVEQIFLCSMEYFTRIIIKQNQIYRVCYLYIKHCYTVKNPVEFTVFTSNWLPAHLR